MKKFRTSEYDVPHEVLKLEEIHVVCSVLDFGQKTDHVTCVCYKSRIVAHFDSFGDPLIVNCFSFIRSL